MRCPYGYCTGPARESSMFFISYLRDPQGRRTCGCLAAPYGHVRELTQPELTKIPYGRRIWPYRCVRALYGPRTGCSRFLTQYGARKLIMHALNSTGRTGPVKGNSPVKSPHKGPVTRKMFPFDDIMYS